jgi:hypothetical protein
MKSYEFLIEKKHKKSPVKKAKHDDWEDKDDLPNDPDEDKVPHILMQLRKALDVDGDYLIKFKDGTKHKIPHEISKKFVERYLTLKPADREVMQDMAVASLEGFKKALSQKFSPLSEPSIYNR